MKIRYNGEKKLKRVEYNNKTFYFAPTCEVEDLGTLRFLLDSDRKGLFSVIKEEKLAKVSLANKASSASNLASSQSKHNVGQKKKQGRRK